MSQIMLKDKKIYLKIFNLNISANIDKAQSQKVKFIWYKNYKKEQPQIN